MKKLISMALTLCMLFTSVIAAPMNVGVELSDEKAEVSVSVAENAQLTDAPTVSFLGNPDIDTSLFGELVLYEDYQAGYTVDETIGLNTWNYARNCYRNPTFFTGGLNAENSTSGICKSEDGGNLYRSSTQNLNQWYFVNNNNGVRISGGAYAPAGQYTAVFDMRIHEDDATYFNGSTTNNKWNYALPSGYSNEWQTYAVTFTRGSDATGEMRFYKQVKFASNDETQTRTVDYDNFALYYMPNRTVIFDDCNDATDNISMTISGRYMTAEQYTQVAMPVKEGYVFKGWSETRDGEVIQNLATYDFTEDKILYAIWEEGKPANPYGNAPEPAWRGADTESKVSELGYLVGYESFNHWADGPHTISWQNESNRMGKNSFEYPNDSYLSSGTEDGINVFKSPSYQYILTANAIKGTHSVTPDAANSSDKYIQIDDSVQWQLLQMARPTSGSDVTAKDGTYYVVLEYNFPENTAMEYISGLPRAYGESTNIDGGNAATNVKNADVVKNQWTAIVSQPFVKTADRNIFEFFAMGGKFKTDASYDKSFKIDNLAIYYLPNRTITFEVDSSKATVNMTTLAVSGKYADLSTVKVTEEDAGKFEFVGWTIKDGDGTIISADTTNYYNLSDVTLVAVFNDNVMNPVTSDVLEIRRRSPMGLRSMASISYEQRNEAVEYGYIVALTDALGEEELTFDADCKKIHGIAYDGNEIDIIYDTDDVNERLTFTGVFHGIPATQKAYNTSLTFRPYIKYMDETRYGKAISKSLFQAATEIKAGESFTNMSIADQNTINEIIKIGTPPFITNGNAEDVDNVAFTGGNATVTIIDDVSHGGNHVYNLEAEAGSTYTYFIQKGVKYEEGKRYIISFDLCYTGISDPTVTAPTSAKVGITLRYNDSTDTSTGFKDHVPGSTSLDLNVWKHYTCTATIENLEDNSVSQFTLFADPYSVGDKKYGVSFMVDNVVVESADEYQFELMGNVYDKDGNEKDPTTFEVGEEATFKIGVFNTAGERVTNCEYLKYTVSYDDGQASESAVVDATSGEITVNTKGLTTPGAVRVVASVCDKDGNLLVANSANDPSGLPLHFNGGLIAGFDDIRLTTVETASEKAGVDVANADNVLVMEETFADRSFDEFWAEKLAVLDNVDYSKAEITFDSEDSTFTTYKVYVPFALPGDAENTAENKAAFYMSVPKNAEASSLGIYSTFQGYGVANPAKVKKNGYISLAVCAHSILLGQTSSYYTQLNATGGALYGYGLNRSSTETTADESYFVGMLLRDMVAINFAKQYAEGGNVLFNGQNVEFLGGSQGAFQSVAMAGLLGDEATKLELSVPWMCDLNAVNTGRQNHEFRPNWASTGCHVYFDTGLFAKRVTCDTTIKAGLGDYTCPPAGIIAMYHNLGSENKSITLHQNMVHSGTKLPLSESLSYTHNN